MKVSATCCNPIADLGHDFEFKDTAGTSQARWQLTIKVLVLGVEGDL